jgi:hypothetical protein
MLFSVSISENPSFTRELVVGLEVVVVKSQFFADGNFSGAKLITNEFSDLMPIF